MDLKAVWQSHVDGECDCGAVSHFDNLVNMHVDQTENETEALLAALRHLLEHESEKEEAWVIHARRIMDAAEKMNRLDDALGIYPAFVYLHTHPELRVSKDEKYLSRIEWHVLEYLFSSAALCIHDANVWWLASSVIDKAKRELNLPPHQPLLGVSSLIRYQLVEYKKHIHHVDVHQAMLVVMGKI